MLKNHRVGVPTEEQIIRIRTEASDLENFYQIKELPMYVANHSDRCSDMYNIALLHQKLFSFGTNCFYH